MSACASFKTQYAPEVTDPVPIPWDSLQLAHRIFLIGDAGYANADESNPVLAVLQNHLLAADENSSIIFLGDNIYPRGLPPKKKKTKREAAEKVLLRELDILKGFRGAAYFIPGEHDWLSGRDQLEDEEEFVEDYLNEELFKRKDREEHIDYWLPDDACPGPEVVEISQSLVIVFIDSHWWLANWDQEPEMHDGCNIRSRSDFAFFLEEALRKHRHKNVIVATHHGFESYGPHGQQYDISAHLFPLREISPSLYFPLPGLGSVALFLRSMTGSPQDLSNGRYQQLVAAMMHAAKKNGEYIFVSGHEHSLQYIKRSGQHQLIAGSGAVSTSTRLGPNAMFTSSLKGFAELAITTTGEVYARFWSAEPDSVIFNTRLKGPLPMLVDSLPQSFPGYPPVTAGISTKAVNYDISQGGRWKNFWFGRHYRDMYLEDFEFPILDLATYEGGLQVLKRGGGNQTNSLRLVDPHGRIYNLRSVSKDPSRLLPYPFNRISLADDIIVDNFLSTHAFAAIAVADLAEATGVYHSNPKLYYLPKQPGLGIYNSDFGGEVYLLEERIDEVYSDRSNFGYPEDIESTGDVVEELIKNHNARVNQQQALRSRLFDLMIGDWDRHDDQWKWAVHYENGEPVYSPIPRDRDQAFSKYDGAVAFVARQFPDGFLHQLRPYSEEINDVRWAGWSARFFDRSFLNNLEWEDWSAVARGLRENLTDSVIENAFARWPANARELTASEIQHFLRARRDNIDKIARSLYEHLAREVDVLGSEQKELFEIIHLPEGKLMVKMWDTNKKGEHQQLLYQRLFLPGETKEIHLYGMDDDDIFRLSGKDRSPIRVRMIGGLGEDKFIDESQTGKLFKKHWVYDDLSDDNELKGRGLKDCRSKKRELNLYNRRADHYNYDHSFIFPLAGYNVENGLSLV